MKEALTSSKTSVLTRATGRNITEDIILHSHRRENLKSYTDNKIVYILPVIPSASHHLAVNSSTYPPPAWILTTARRLIASETIPNSWPVAHCLKIWHTSISESFALIRRRMNIPRILNDSTNRCPVDWRRGGRGGQIIAPPLPIPRPENFRLRSLGITRLKCSY
jgi:hypothetical protein